ncbi:MAG: chemotaxis protein CheW [Bacteroidota bacterium]
MDKPKMNISDKEILKRRATKLAKKTNVETDQNEEQIFMLCFELASQTYCLDTSFIKEVLVLKDLTPIPNTPDFVIGVINVRGQILAVYNAKKIFNVKEIGIKDQNKVIILKDNDKDIEFGLLVDGILGNIKLSLHEIESIPDSLNETGKEYLKGITDNGIIVINTKGFIESPLLIIKQF